MSIKSVLIIRCGALGDLVASTSVIDAIKLQFGSQTIIDFVSTPGAGSLLKDDPRVNHVFPLKHKKIPIIFSSQKKSIIHYSKKENYDLLINFERGKQFKSLVQKVKAKKKVGHFFTTPKTKKDGMHTVEVKKLMFEEVVDKEVFEKSFPRLIGTPKEDIFNKYNLSKRYIIISPSNSHQKRNLMNYRAWENKSWVELIHKLSKEIEVVIVGNKGEDTFFDELKPYPSNVVDLVGKTPLPDLIGVINNATGLVATDTGTAHIASAVSTEVFALIGPTPANETGPYKTPTNKVHIISLNLECSPCYKTQVMKDCRDNVCMKGINAQMVYDEISNAKLLIN